MSIVVIVLSAIFLALGAVPPVAGSIAAGRVREKLHAPVTVDVQAVPTWRIFAGQVDRLQLVAGAMTLGEVPISGLTVQGGPCRLDAPCRMAAEMAIATWDLQPLIQSNLKAYAESMADSLGVPGAQVADVVVDLGDKTVVSGRFEALAGLVSLPFRVEGRLARLGPKTVGLMGAMATIDEHIQPLGNINVWTMPESPVDGVQVALQRLAVEGDHLKAWLQLDVARPADLLRSDR